MLQNAKQQRSLELPPGAEVITPTLDDITPDLRRKFAERLVEGTYKRLGPELEEGNESEAVEIARMECRDVLRHTKGRATCTPDEWERLKQVIRTTTNEVDDKDRDNTEEVERFLQKEEADLSEEEWNKLMNLVYPTHTQQEEIEGYIKTIERGLENGNFFAIRAEDGNIAAIISAHDGFITWPDGRKCFEIGRAATLPEYGGRGFYKILTQRAQERISESDSGAPIMRGTKTEAVKTSLRKKGMKEVPFDLGLDPSKVDTESLEYKVAKSYRDRIDQFSPLVTKKWIRDGYSLFYVDPKEE